MKKLNIALVAHDARKSELCDWVKWNKVPLSQHNLFATGTTARVVSVSCGNEVHALLSGPLGGDQQIGSMIAEGKIDILIFFCDNLITQGHQQDVGALVRLASLYNIGFATNRTTADMLLTSPLFGSEDYDRIIPKSIYNYSHRFDSDDVDEIEELNEVDETIEQDI